MAGAWLVLLGQLANDRFGRQQQPEDRRRVLQRTADHLGRIDQADGGQGHVVAHVAVAALHLLNDERTFLARVVPVWREGKSLRSPFQRIRIQEVPGSARYTLYSN